MKNYGDDLHLPQLKKEVNIAGVYNGVLNMNEEVNEIIIDKQGKPSRMNPHIDNCYHCIRFIVVRK